MRYEISISIDKPEHLDAMILGLVHQGYDVYYNDDEKKLCFTGSDYEVKELEERK